MNCKVRGKIASIYKGYKFTPGKNLKFSKVVDYKINIKTQQCSYIQTNKNLEDVMWKKDPIYNCKNKILGHFLYVRRQENS